MLPVSSAYFEPRICASNRWACSPAHASLSAALASAGLSLSSAAAAVSPVASAVKNFSAVGSGPFGLGVHALSDATTTATVTRLAARVAVESHVAIEADVTNLRPKVRVGAPCPLRRIRGLRPVGPCGRRAHHQWHCREVRGHLGAGLAQRRRTVALLAVGRMNPNPDVDLATGQFPEHHADLRRAVNGHQPRR